jgi:hypothetical protein
MKKENAIRSRFFSTLLISALMSGAIVSAPVALAEEVTPVKSLEMVNFVGYKLTSTTDTIMVDLADMYGYHFAYIAVKKRVSVGGKLVFRYVPVDLVVLDAFGKSTIKTLVGIKLGDTIRVSLAGFPNDEVIRWQLVK